MTTRGSTARIALARGLAALLLLVVVVIPVMALTALLTSIGHDDAGPADAADLPRRAALAVAEKGALAERLRRLRADGARIAGLLPAAAGNVAAAAMQGAARQIVVAAGGALQSAQAAPAGVQDGLERIDARLEFTLPAPALADLLAAFAAADPALVIVELVVHAAAQGAEAAPLQIRCTVRGFRRVAPA